VRLKFIGVKYYKPSLLNVESGLPGKVKNLEKYAKRIFAEIGLPKNKIIFWRRFSMDFPEIYVQCQSYFTF